MLEREVNRGGLSMLFDKNFDKSLWLLIKGDRRNRGKIVDFVKSLSSEFILMIQEGLLEYEKYKKRNEEIPLNDREYECFDNQIYNGLGELYSFNIDPKKDILSITKSIYILGSYYRNFSIKLMNISENKDKSMMRDIGCLCYPIDGVGNLRKVNYSIMDIGLTNVLVSSSNNDIYRFCGIVEIDNDVDLNLDNINRKLVRTKKIDNRKDNKNV